MRSDLEMLLGLADQLDVSMPHPDELHRLIVAQVAKDAPDFSFGDSRFGERGMAPPARAWRDILSGGGTWEHDPTLAALRS